MALSFDNASNATEVSGSVVGDLLDKNALTTAGVLVGAGTAVAGAGILTVALPAQVFGATAISAGLIYAGDRQSKGLKILANPFAKPEEEATPVVEAAATAA